MAADGGSGAGSSARGAHGSPGVHAAEGSSRSDLPTLQPLGPAGEQGTLFADGLFVQDEADETGALLGYRGPAACQIVGITYRQLDYWARTKLVVPSIRSAHGSGSQRLYSFKDLAVLKVVKNLLDTGVSLNNIRLAVEQLRRHGIRDLARITLFSDGVTVYECTSPEEVVDLLQGGQGVFGIAIGGAMREISGSIAQFPAERADAAVVEPAPEDELAAARRNRGARSAG